MGACHSWLHPLFILGSSIFFLAIIYLFDITYLSKCLNNDETLCKMLGNCSRIGAERRPCPIDSFSAARAPEAGRRLPTLDSQVLIILCIFRGVSIWAYLWPLVWSGGTMNTDMSVFMPWGLSPN